MGWIRRERRLPRRSRGQRGQAVVLIAFSITFVISLLGLSVDSVRLYILYNQAQRAAEAGALAGVLYMPDFFSPLAPAIDGNSAVSRACAETAKNGVPCATGPGLVGAWPSQVPGKPNDLLVTVTLAADNFLLALLNPSLASSTVVATSTAEYLPPVQLGSRLTYFGDQTRGDQFYAAVDGPQDLKEYGDALTPIMEEGDSDPIANPDASSFIYTTSYGKSTNHQQTAGWPQPNPNQQPPGFNGTDGAPGYSYEIDVPAASLNVAVQVYNPRYDPGGGSSLWTDDHFQGWENVFPGCSDSTKWLSTLGACHFEEANLYMTMGYSLYKVPLPFERSKDVLVASQTYTPVDNWGPDLTDKGCSPGSEVFDVTTGACAAISSYPDIGAWTTIGTITQAGMYRLTVDAGTIGYGSKQYSVRLVPTMNDPGLRLFAWNDMSVIFTVGGTDQVFDLGNIPAPYAGKTLDFSVYDPGDSGGTVCLRILDPSGNTAALPAWVHTTAACGANWIDASRSYYNGLTLNLPIAIPKVYSGGWWQVEYKTTASDIDDKVTIAISLKGNPLHLVG